MPSMTIPLTRGKVAIVDAEDFDRVNQFRWRSWRSERSATWYAIRSISRWRCRAEGLKQCVYMHRFIIGAPDGIEVDHQNLDGLDNRRENLRLATHRQNTLNIARKSNNTSGFVGIYFNKRRGRWDAYAQASLKRQYGGSFATAEEAARARDALARVLHGEFARLNFPDES